MLSSMGNRGPEIDLVGLAKEFLGQWVALDPDSRAVVASGSSAKGVLEAAEEAGVACPVVLQVSDEYGSLAP